jgi:hypothetical protein
VRVCVHILAHEHFVRQTHMHRVDKSMHTMGKFLLTSHRAEGTLEGGPFSRWTATDAGCSASINVVLSQNIVPFASGTHAYTAQRHCCEVDR